MKKNILLALCILFIASLAGAAPKKEEVVRPCTYTPLQTMIREARNDEKIKEFIEKGGDFSVPFRCGGNILQLAILRGNPFVLKTILEAGVEVNENVSLKDFPIENAPPEIPAIMFAAFYAPRTEILDLMIQAGADMTVLDKNNENLLWYLNQNPVLLSTDLSDKVRDAILFHQADEPENPLDSVDGKAPSAPMKRKSLKTKKPVEIVEPDLPDSQKLNKQQKNLLLDSAFE